MMNPQTPTRKLFKPSSKTKTPTTAKKQRPSNQPQTEGSMRPEGFSRQTSSISQSTGSLPACTADDITKSTTLEPPTSASGVASNKFADYTSSNTIDDAPICLVDNDTLTSTDGISRSTDVPSVSSKRASEVTTSAKPEEALDAKKPVIDQTSGVVKSIAGKPQELLRTSVNDLPEPSNPTDTLNSPIDIARYFAEQGNPEMSNFSSVIAGKSPYGPKGTIDDTVNASKKDALGDLSEARHRALDKDSMLGMVEELPREDRTPVASENGRMNEAIGEAPRDVTQTVPDITNSGGDINKDENTVSETLKATPTSINQIKSLAHKPPSLSEPAAIPEAVETAEGVEINPDNHILGAAPTNTISESNITGISKGVHVDALKNNEKVDDSTQDATAGNKQVATDITSEVHEGGTQFTANIGQPEHIERRIDIPLPQPEKATSSPFHSTKPNTNGIAYGLGGANELPETEELQNTEDLPNLPGGVSQEEILNPSVRSTSTNISPIPKVPNITPLGMAPPPDLSHLAHGLGGNVVDDVGNIVDGSGKVLGHATGDLPAMVGKNVADNGEIYGDGGEVIGYASENFIASPPPTDIPNNILGSLKIDHEGNILDTNGNIIGRFNEKAGRNGPLAPFMTRPKTSESQTEDKPRGEKKPKATAHSGGSPSDIFLDVKSTTDGIQLTIRIPTTFGRQQQD
ncbi:hypothetical protein AAE478_007316 [Parahypoxylon ruwenzoriense]